MELQPVDLIQVGDAYFVRDGHHRISVARTFGAREIDALVTVWEVDGRLPWQRPIATTPVERAPDMRVVDQPRGKNVETAL